jgi:hypothetical protein
MLQPLNQHQQHQPRAIESLLSHSHPHPRPSNQSQAVLYNPDHSIQIHATQIVDPNPGYPDSIKPGAPHIFDSTTGHPIQSQIFDSNPGHRLQPRNSVQPQVTELTPAIRYSPKPSYLSQAIESTQIFDTALGYRINPKPWTLTVVILRRVSGSNTPVG